MYQQHFVLFHPFIDLRCFVSVVARQAKTNATPVAKVGHQYQINE
jgi:hypothetical protein